MKPLTMSAGRYDTIRRHLAKRRVLYFDQARRLLAEIDALRAAQSATGKMERPTNAALREAAAEVMCDHPDFMNLPRHARVAVYDDLAEWADSLLATAEAAASARERAAVVAQLELFASTYESNSIQAVTLRGVKRSIECGGHRAGEEGV